MRDRTKNSGVSHFVYLLFYYLQRWKLTNFGYLIKNLISSACVFLVTCYAVRENVFDKQEATKSCLFAVLMCLIWSGVFNSIVLFFSEEDYTMDDLTKVLSVRVYIIANAIIQFLLCFIEAMLCTTIFYLYFQYDTEGLVFGNINFDYVLTFFLVLFSADMLGFAVGIFVKRITTAMTLLPVVLIAQFLFSGCLFELDGVLKAISRYTSAKWGFSALGSLADLNHIPSKMADTIPDYHPDPSELFDATRSFVTDCWIHLVLLSVLAIAIAAILLYFKLNETGQSLKGKLTSMM